MSDLIDRTIGDRCIMLIEMEWQREANDDPRENAPCGWFRPADQFMFKPAEGAPGVHGIAPLEALPRILAALEPVAAPDPATIREAALIEAALEWREAQSALNTFEAENPGNTTRRWVNLLRDKERAEEVFLNALALIHKPQSGAVIPKGAADDRA